MQKSFLSISILVLAITMLVMFICSVFAAK